MRTLTTMHEDQKAVRVLALMLVFLTAQSADEMHASAHDELFAAIHQASLVAKERYQTIGVLNIKKSLFHGDEEKLKMIMEKAYRGESIKISAVGGSVTQGQGLADGDAEGVERYTERVARWANESGLKINVTNGGFAACSSSYFASCVNLHVPIDADIVIVELAANDPWAYSDDTQAKRVFERLIRKLLMREARPAIILVNAYHHAFDFGEDDQESLYLHNSEAFFFDVSTYYGLPLASTKAALWHLSHLPGFWINNTWFHQVFDYKNQKFFETPPKREDLSKYLFFDSKHFTSVNGHRAMSEQIIGILLHASRQLLLHNEVDHEGSNSNLDPLPPPIFKGNEATPHETCLVGDGLRKSVVETKGNFSWLDEARKEQRPKWGFTGFGSGSELKIKLATSLDLPKTNESSNNQTEPPIVTISVGYLTSYDPVMADFEVSCVSGCSCRSWTFEGLDTSRKASQISMRQIEVSQSPECIISIKIKGNQTGSTPVECKERCKVKIGAMVVEDSVGWTSAYIDMEKLELMGGIFGPGGKEFGTNIKKLQP